MARPKKTTVEAKPKKEKKVAPKKVEEKKPDNDILAEATAFEGNFNTSQTDKEALGNLIEKIETKDFYISEKAIEEIYAHKISIEPNMEAILAKYEEKVNTQSDINELLPIIKEVASNCETIVEFGVRDPTSTYAILAGNPKKLTSYDIVRHPNVAYIEEIAPNFEFILGNSLEVEIKEVDMMLLDTYHLYEQLKAELKRHSPKVRKFILMHDSISFGYQNEPPYENLPHNIYPPNHEGKTGLMPAITEFLQEGNFVIDFHAQYNNGLMVLRRVR